MQLTLPHAVELLAIHGPVRDPCLPDLSESHDLNSGVFGGADSTAPSSGRAPPPIPGPITISHVASLMVILKGGERKRGKKRETERGGKSERVD